VNTRRKPTKAEQRAETMEQILDEAELLFSKHGLHGVTLKDVAKRVGVHHTLLNYYFEDKKRLFDAVFSRRAVVTSERRMRALDEYDRSCAGKPTVEGALRAFLDTDLDLYIEGGEGWKNYAALGAQVAASRIRRRSSSGTGSAVYSRCARCARVTVKNPAGSFKARPDRAGTRGARSATPRPAASRPRSSC
jgi:AcrR family transcriptional regulator